MSTFIKRGGLVAAVLTSCLMLALSAHAASFDCGKAQTKVEHLICDNPEISKLDDELSVAYKAALKDEKQTDAIKQAQKQWMKERNGCADAACVQNAYQKRIEQLQPAQKATAQSAVSNANVSAPTKKYPPYPDVWDWVMPDRETITGRGVQLFGMDTGDVLFRYAILDKDGKWVDHQPITLFSHLTVSDADASPLIAGHDLPVAHLSDGTLAHLESKEEAFKYILQGIPLAGGFKLREGGFQPIGSAYSSCYRGPARASYSIIDYANHKLIRSVVIFKLLDKPKRIDIGKGCISESEQSFTTRVESVDGLNARALADGGFVMQLEYGVLIRFDKNFHSRSLLINDKYFVLDNTIKETDDDKEPETDYWIYINRITGKPYRKGPEYSYDYQAVVDDLYNHLMSLKAKKGAAK